MKVYKANASVLVVLQDIHDRIHDFPLFPSDFEMELFERLVSLLEVICEGDEKILCKMQIHIPLQCDIASRLQDRLRGLIEILSQHYDDPQHRHKPKRKPKRKSKCGPMH